jgi:hypothetical protein
MDLDKDGVIGIVDLTRIRDNVSVSSILYKEVSDMIVMYKEKNLLPKYVRY